MARRTQVWRALSRVPERCEGHATTPREVLVSEANEGSKGELQRVLRWMRSAA